MNPLKIDPGRLTRKDCAMIAETLNNRPRKRPGFRMPNARVFNPPLRAFADRLITSGKKRKQVIIAVIRKQLLHQIYGILESGVPYNPEKRGYAGS